MTITTNLNIGERVFSVAKVAGTWQAGGGFIVSVTVATAGGVPKITYFIDADSGPDVTRRESICFKTLAEATDLAADLNA